MAKSFGECLKESSKAYLSGVWKGFKDSMKVMIPVSAGIVILGAVALKAVDEDLDEDPETNEEAPDEESTCDKNLKNVEKTFFKVE